MEFMDNINYLRTGTMSDFSTTTLPVSRTVPNTNKAYTKVLLTNCEKLREYKNLWKRRVLQNSTVYKAVANSLVSLCLYYFILLKYLSSFLGKFNSVFMKVFFWSISYEPDVQNMGRKHVNEARDIASAFKELLSNFTIT